MIRDAENNTMSFIQTIEQYNFENLPTQLPPFHIGTFWEVDEEDPTTYKVKFSFFSPSSDEIISKIFENSFIKDKVRQRLNIMDFQCKVEMPGRHYMKIEVAQRENEWEEVGGFPIYIAEKA